MGTDIEEARDRRVLAQVSPEVRILCLNAPDGSDSERVAARWAQEQHLSQPWSQYQADVHQFAEASGAEILSTPDTSDRGALILRYREGIVEGSDLEAFLDETADLPIAFVSTVSHNGTSVFFSRPDAVILLPETLFYTPDELQRVFVDGDADRSSDPWEATAGWPLAVSVLQERSRPQRPQSLLALRRCSLALLNWITGANQDMRSLIAQLAFSPGFNDDLLRELGDPSLSGEPLNLLRTMGLAAPSDAGSLRNRDGWYAMTGLMAEALRTQIMATEATRGRRLQQQVLEGLAAVGEPNLAMKHAMDVGDWDAAERLIVDDWGLASAYNAGSFSRSLKRFFEKRRRGPYGEFTDPEVAQVLSSSINVLHREGQVQYHFVPTYPVVDDIGQYHVNVQRHPVSPRAPFLDLMMRMQTKRMHGRWQAAAEVATLIEERLEVTEAAQTAQLSHQAEHAILWYQVGFTRLLNAEFTSAESAYRRALRIATINKLDVVTAKCAGHLRLLSCLQGVYVSPSGDEPRTVSPEISSSRSLQDVYRVTEGFNALWSLDRELLYSVVDPMRQAADTELWPFQFFLGTMYELLFGNQSFAQQQISQQKGSMTTPEHGLLGDFVVSAEALCQLMHGSYARVIDLAERKVPDTLRTLAPVKIAALLAQGDVDAARRFANQKTHTPDFVVQSDPAALIALAAAPSVENGEPLTADLRHTRSDDGGLFNVLPLWFLGVPAGELQRSFGLTELQTQRVTDVQRPNTEVPRALPQLTEREQQIVRALAEGVSRKALAERLFVSVNTVKTHIAACYRKLGADNRHDALQEAARRGYL